MPDNCKFSSGDVAKVDDDARLQAGGKDCTFEKGAVILLSYDAPESDPAPVPTKESPVNPVMTPAQAAPVRHEAAHVAHAAAPTPLPIPTSEETPAPAMQDAVAPAELAELQAHTEVSSALGADDMAKIMESAGGNPMLALGMAAFVIVGGGGAMWKFIQQKGKASAELDQKRAEQEHELKLRELDLKAQSSSGPDYSATQPPPCQAAAVRQEQAIASLSGQVSSHKGELEELRAKLAKVEKKSASFSADFDADELKELVEKHEKELKALRVKRTKVA